MSLQNNSGIGKIKKMTRSSDWQIKEITQKSFLPTSWLSKKEWAKLSKLFLCILKLDFQVWLLMNTVFSVELTYWSLINISLFFNLTLIHWRHNLSIFISYVLWNHFENQVLRVLINNRDLLEIDNTIFVPMNKLESICGFCFEVVLSSVSSF